MWADLSLVILLGLLFIRILEGEGLFSASLRFAIIGFCIHQNSLVYYCETGPWGRLSIYLSLPIYLSTIYLSAVDVCECVLVCTNVVPWLSMTKPVACSYCSGPNRESALLSQSCRRVSYVQEHEGGVTGGGKRPTTVASTYGLQQYILWVVFFCHSDLQICRLYSL